MLPFSQHQESPPRRYIYEWNSEGQLTTVKDKDTGSVIASYTYDPDGLRKTKTVGSTTYKYFYDNTNLIRVTDGTQTLWTYTWDNGKPVSMTDSAGNSYLIVTNYRGDVVELRDYNGEIAASYEYDPWGKVLLADESSSLTNQPLRYASYVYDTETELYYLKARYYDQDTARFISRDPDGGDKDNPLNQNAYAYANGDPVNNVDPDGQWAFLIGAAINIGIYYFTTPDSERSVGGYVFAAATGAVGGFGTAAVGSSIAARVIYNSVVTSRGRLLAGQAAHRVWSAGFRLVVPGGKYNKAITGTRLRPDFQIGKVSVELKKYSQSGREAMKKARSKYGKHGSFTIPWYY